MRNAILFCFIGGLLIWAFVSRQAIPLALAIGVALVWAFRSDTRMWREKPREELVAMIKDGDWRYWQTALEELRRRGEDISPFIPRLVSCLVSDSVLSRAAADAALKDLFPEFKEHLLGYLPTHDVATTRQRLEPLLTKYGI